MEFNLVNGLYVVSHRGKSARTYKPKDYRAMPDNIAVARRNGNEALLEFLGSPSYLQKAPLEKYLLDHIGELQRITDRRQDEPVRFSFRPVYYGIGRPKSFRIEYSTPASLAALLSHLAMVIFSRLGEPEQVLTRMDEQKTRDLEWIISDERGKEAALSRPAVIREADLDGLDLSGADLSGLHFKYCYFNNTILRRANFTGARLYDCSFMDSDLTGAIFCSAYLGNNTTFVGADLTRADWAATQLGLVNPHYSFNEVKGQVQGRPIIMETFRLKSYKEVKHIFPDGYELAA